MQQQVLDGMISEALMNQAIEDLGIEVTAEELSNAMVGAGATPQMIQIAQSMGAATPAQLHDMIFNPDNYGIPAEQANQLREIGRASCRERVYGLV